MVSKTDTEAEAEVVKREPLDLPRGMVLLLVSVCMSMLEVMSILCMSA